MKLFSHRSGLKTIKDTIQKDVVDEDLRNRLWNALMVNYWDTIESYRLWEAPEIKLLMQHLWHDYFKFPLDTLSSNANRVMENLREYYFSCRWYEVYDFIEFIANSYDDEDVNNNFINICNSILTEELSAYRFVGGHITEITSDEEMESIEEALQLGDQFKPVTEHINQALTLLSDRKTPDYRNSIKESVSAVESMCKIVTEDKNATLGQVLKHPKIKEKIHPALVNGFSNIYGYTSGADGIRHGMLDLPKIMYEDAKIMLVMCVAFINFIKVKF